MPFNVGVAYTKAPYTKELALRILSIFTSRTRNPSRTRTRRISSAAGCGPATSRSYAGTYYDPHVVAAASSGYGCKAKSPVAEVSHHCHRGSDKEPLNLTRQS